MSNNENLDLMQKVISLCKRRGFIYPSSEIYGGYSAIYDYGPYGVELAQAIKREWWRVMVQYREDILGLDSSIFMHPKIWEASGHVKGFSDPLVECKDCHTRSRADHLLEEIGVFADEKMSEGEINEIFKKIWAKSCALIAKKAIFRRLKSLIFWFRQIWVILQGTGKKNLVI